MLSILLCTIIIIALLGNTINKNNNNNNNNSNQSIINSWCCSAATLINDTIIYNNENTFNVEPLLWPLTLHLTQIFCNFIPFEMYIYYEKDVDTNWINTIIKEINKCAPSAMFIVSYNKMDETIPKLNDNGALTFVLNILYEPNDIDLSFIEKKSSYKYRWYFISVFEKLIEDDKAGLWLKNIFNQFWSLNVLNTVIYYAHTHNNNNNNNNNNTNNSNNNSNNFKIMTYSPFVDENIVIELLSENITMKPEVIFTEKLLNMNKYPLRISLFREETRAQIFANGTYMGTDALMTKLIIDKMNATFVHLPPTDGNDIGEFLPSGGATGSLAQILNNEVDVSFNSRFYRLKQFYKKVEATHTIGRDDVCILVTKSGLASNISNLFRTFNIIVWIAIIIAPFFIYFIFKFIYKIQIKRSSDDNDNDDTDNIENMFLTFFGWNLVQSKKKLPKRWAPKFLIAFWIMYCLLITSSYNGNLTSNLVLKRTLPDIDTIKQLEQSNYPLLTYTRYVDLIQSYLNQSSTNSFKRLKKNVRGVTPDVLSSYIKVNDVRYAYANKYHINKHIVKSKSHFYRGRPIFKLMSECPVPYVVTYAVTYGSPYLGRFNTILRVLQENGIFKLWERATEQTGKISTSITDNAIVSLSISHLQSAFYVLLIGLMLSTFVFFYELVTYKLKNKYKKS